MNNVDKRLLGIGLLVAVMLAAGCGGSSPGGASSKQGPSLQTLTKDGSVLVLEGGGVYSVNPADRSTVSAWHVGDRIYVGGSNDDSLTDLTRGKMVSDTFVGDTGGDSADVNPFPEGRYKLRTGSADGGIVVLDDGSIWGVRGARDRSTAASWTGGSSMTVTRSSSGSVYKLVNTGARRTVKASYVGDE